MSDGSQGKRERLHRLVLYVNSEEYRVVRLMAEHYRPQLSVSQAGRLMLRAHVDAILRQEAELDEG